MGKAKSFTSSDATNGNLMSWVNQVYIEYAAPCPISQVATQVTTTTVASTVANTVSNVVSSAASPPPAPSSSESSESSSSSSKSESKSESKKENKKDEKKKEKAKTEMTPLVFSSDLTSIQQLQDAGFNLMANIGVSRSSLSGDVSYGATGIIWSNLQQFAISSRYSINSLKNGQLNGVYTYSLTNAYNKGTFLHIGAFSYVKPIKTNIYGYNIAIIGTSIPYMLTKQIYLMSSITAFMMHIMIINKKFSMIPEIYLMSSPYSYTIKSQDLNKNYEFSYIFGNTINYQISKKFALSGNLKYLYGSSQSIGLLIGSRFGF